MAKQLHEIKGFHQGLNTSSTDVDTPDDTATTSLNVNPKSKFGRLSPTRKDISLNKNFLASDMIFIKDKIKGYILIGFEGNPLYTETASKIGWIKVIENFYEDNL